MIKSAVSLSFALMLGLISSCSLGQYLGQAFLSDAQEEKLGEEFHQQLLANKEEYPLLKTNTPEKQELENYLNEVFNSVWTAVPKAHKPAYKKKKFKFTIVDKDIVNAFAVPGGYIYIYTGILKEMKDEAELAGVIGHEMAHVTQHHYRRYAMKAAVIQKAVDAVVGGESTLKKFVTASFGVLSGSYLSRDHETESDEYGTQYLALSKRSPNGIATFFERQKNSPKMLTWIGSHPNPSERVKDVEKIVKGHPEWKKYAGKTYQDKFEKGTVAVK